MHSSPYEWIDCKKAVHAARWVYPHPTFHCLETPLHRSYAGIARGNLTWCNACDVIDDVALNLDPGPWVPRHITKVEAASGASPGGGARTQGAGHGDWGRGEKASDRQR